MSDRVSLLGLRARGRHGVFDTERMQGQEFVLDVTVLLDTRDAAATDDLRRTVDYGRLARGVCDVVEGEPVALIETLAQRIADRCLAEDRVEAVEVTVHKPHAPLPVPFGDVTVTISRSRSESPAPGWPARAAAISLGSNLGDRLEALQGAVDGLAATPGVAVTAVSPVYETAPVGGPEQPDYLNAVVLVDTTLAPAALLARAAALEDAAGRVRDRRWGPRTLDVDLLQVGDETRSEPELTLPHPRAHERAFVLAPWRDVAPEAVLPGRGRVADLLAGLPAPGPAGPTGLRRRDDLRLRLPPT